MIYLSTFTNGLQRPITEILKSRLKDLRIVKTIDGAILYETDIDYERHNFKCFENTFLVLKKFNSLSKNPIETMIRQTVGKIDRNILKDTSKKSRSFRVITSNESNYVSIDNDLRALVEREIKKLSGLTVNRMTPDEEFWFLYRREGIGFFMKRLTKAHLYERGTKRGELQSEFANVMNYIGGVSSKDIFVDPMCGTGAIPYDASLNCLPYQLHAYDIEEDKIALTEAKFAKAKSLKLKTKIFISKLDVLDIQKAVQPNTVDVIVTDPPWGAYKHIKDIETFYENMLRNMYAILKNNGRCVLLVGRNNSFLNALNEFVEEFEVADYYDVLVTGKKSRIYKLIAKK